MYVTVIFLMFELVKQDKVTFYLGDIMNVFEVTGVDSKTSEVIGGRALLRGHQTYILQVFFVPKSLLVNIRW